MAEEGKNELEELKQKCEEYLSGWKRERADFLNYKKDEAARVGELCNYANQKFILKILPILDNIELAEDHLKDDGILQIIKQFKDILSKEGVEQIEVIGKPFDPECMEVIEEIDRSPSSIENGEVVEEAQKGYTVHGKLLRPAKVKITK